LHWRAADHDAAARARAHRQGGRLRDDVLRRRARYGHADPAGVAAASPLHRPNEPRSHAPSHLAETGMEAGASPPDLMGKPSTEKAWSSDDRELMRADMVLAGVMKSTGPIHPEIDRRGSRTDPWEALARAIVGQQLSTRAAASIWSKLLAIFGGDMPTPEQ